MQKLEFDDPTIQPLNLVDQNIAQLRKLFPGLVTESAAGAAVNLDVLKQLVGDHTTSDAEEKYGLVWYGKRRARQLALTPSIGTLRPFPSESVDWDTTQNLMIEGDNLEVLKILGKSYARKVKLIYIDPPYNTGSDFVYADDFRDSIRNYQELTGQIAGGKKLTSNPESSGRFHTDWLNMMYPRLEAAKSMLRDDGIILINIDDHEFANLRRICDEVFDEVNFIAAMVWEKGRKNDARLLSVGHEYILIYARSLNHLREVGTLWREEKPGAREIWEQYLKLRANHGTDDRAIERDLSMWYSSLPRSHPSKKWSRYKRVDANGPWRDHDISWPGGGGPRYDVFHPVTKLPCKVPDDGWRFSKPEEMQRQIKLGLVEFREDHTEPPFRKAHIRPVPDELVENEDDESSPSEADGDEFAMQVRGSYFYKQSQVAVKFLRKLLGGKVFNNPKDHVELAKLISYMTAGDPHAVIMDFFAGSGSTGHAVMDLNATDGGSRRYMLVQLPEPLDPNNKDQELAAKYCDSLGRPRNIAELTKERLRRAAKTAREDHPMFPGDLGFRVFKLDSSNIRAWEPDPDNLGRSLEEYTEHLKIDRTENDILYELLLRLGLDLCVPIETKSIGGKEVHSIGGGVLLVCLTMSIDFSEVEVLGQGIVNWHKVLSPAGETTCVFRDSAFVDDVTKTNLTSILHQHGLETVRSV